MERISLRLVVCVTVVCGLSALLEWPDASRAWGQETSTPEGEAPVKAEEVSDAETSAVTEEETEATEETSSEPEAAEPDAVPTGGDQG